MYYCLTGKPPIHPTGLMPEAVRQLLDQEIQVDGLGASAELRAIIRKATDRSPEKRYQHAADLLADLRQTPEAFSPPTGPNLMWDPQVDLDLAENKAPTMPVYPPEESDEPNAAGGKGVPSVPEPPPPDLEPPGAPDVSNDTVIITAAPVSPPPTRSDVAVTSQGEGWTHIPWADGTDDKTIV